MPAYNVTVIFPDIQICAVIERKMNEIIDEINKKHTIIEQDPLDSE